ARVRAVFELNGVHSAEDRARGSSSRTDLAIQQALNEIAPIRRRADGKPLSAVKQSFSAAHAENLMLAVAAQTGVACDLEFVVARSARGWCDLLGEDKFGFAERVGRERGEDLNASATRLWSTLECMKKAGLPAAAPLVLEPNKAAGWVLFRAGTLV